MFWNRIILPVYGTSIIGTVVYLKKRSISNNVSHAKDLNLFYRFFLDTWGKENIPYWGVVTHKGLTYDNMMDCDDVRTNMRNSDPHILTNLIIYKIISLTPEEQESLFHEYGVTTHNRSPLHGKIVDAIARVHGYGFDSYSFTSAPIASSGTSLTELEFRTIFPSLIRHTMLPSESNIIISDGVARSDKSLE